jgi:hypothetical protein
MFVRVLRKPKHRIQVRHTEARSRKRDAFYGIFRFTVYGLLGCALEIVFYNLVRNLKDVPLLGLLFQFDWRVDSRFNLGAVWDAPAISLYGQCSLWMFLVYGVACAAIEWAYANFSDLPIALRALLYGLIIALWEWASGWLLFLLTGYKIWFYADAGNFFQMTSLRIVPVWCIAGLLIEYLYRQLMDPALVRDIESVTIKPKI